MGRRIIYCFTCNGKYDVSHVTPGSRFLCKTCDTTIKVPDVADGFADPCEEKEPLQISDIEILPEDCVVGGPGEGDGLNGMSFTKMVGTGNDFILIDCVREPLEKPEEAARLLCDRRFGAGSDGLLLLLPDEEADIRMRMFNPDGSEAEACGNGLRCLVKYAFAHGHVEGDSIRVATKAGMRTAEIRREDGAPASVRVSMGAPSVNPADIPVNAEPGETLHLEVEALNQVYRGTALSMGNPHYVIFVPDVDAVDVASVGSAIETHARFPNRTNVEFVEVISPEKVRQRTWERGAGETLACGSGASAVCVAGSLLERTGRRVTVNLRGGDLQLEWTESGEVFLEGPADELFTGLWCKS